MKSASIFLKVRLQQVFDEELIICNCTAGVQVVDFDGAVKELVEELYRSNK